MAEDKNKEMVQVEEQKHTNTWEEAMENEAWTAPLSDIIETGDEFIIKAAMPGVGKDNVKIKVEDESLVIMGRIDYNEAVDSKYIMKENEAANFYRKFRLTDSVDDDKINAELESGMLTVTLPKHERVKPRNIDIK